MELRLGRSGVTRAPGANARGEGVCASCAAKTPPMARFCPNCGLDLRPAPAGLDSPAAAERRQLTVVFCDLVGSSGLATRIDPEDLADLIGRFHRCVAETMGRYGGFLARPMGDGALVFFGFPQAHEDDAERAVRASLLAVEAVAGITGPDGRSLHVRIGIATGIAIVGDVADTGSARGLDAAGEAPNLAQRLQQLAEPDTVVVADHVRRLIGPLFVYRDLGRHSLKGWDTPIAVAQVLRPAANPSRFEARVGPLLTPLIGRRATVERLSSLWRQARQGTGRVALITGEPGIGKSRLTAQLMAETEVETHTRLRWFCVAHQQGVALHPCIQQLEHLARIEPEDAPELRRAKLESILRGASAEEFVLIANLLMVPVDQRSEVLQFSLQRRRERTLRAFLHGLIRTCHRGPVLGIMEDAHWADPTTSELLDLVVRQAASLPLLLVVTGRPEFRPDWIDAPAVEPITLEPLRWGEGAELVRGMAGPDTLAENVVQAIVSRCDGVPLFLEEVTRAVLENSGGAGRPGETVPASIHASLLARLDRLGPARKVVEAAAAIGRNFSIELLRHVHETSDQALHAAIRRLVDSGLVLSSGSPGSGEFRFKHTLIQDTAYGMMLRDRRRMLHERIAQALQTEFPRTAIADPQLLAHHCTEAGLVEQAVGWWLRAGTQSLMRAATSEALAQLRRGLELCASLPDTEARRRQELDLQILLGKAIIATQGHAAPGFTASVARARVLCTELGSPPQLLTVLFVEWTQAHLRAELASARKQAEEFLDLARERRDPVWGLLACYAAGFTHFALGSFGPAHDFLRRGLDLFDVGRRDEYASRVVGDPRVMLHTCLAWERMCVGRGAEAWAACDEAVREARALGHSYSVAHALCKQASLHVFIGKPVAGLAVAEELHSLAVEHGIAFFEAAAMVFRGWFRGQLGDPREGLALVRRGGELYRMTGTRLHLQISLRFEAELLGRSGDIAAGLTRLDEARALTEQSGERWDEAEFHRVEGELLDLAGEREAAEMALREAHDIAVAQGAHLFALRASTSLAKLREAHKAPNMSRAGHLLEQLP